MISGSLVTKAQSFLLMEGSLPALLEGVSTDSRKVEHAEIFVALVGEKYDAMLFVEEVLKKTKVVAFTVNEKNMARVSAVKKDYPDACFIGVKDSLLFLQELAGLHVEEWRRRHPEGRVFGITGSNGKTTTKEMLFELLNAALPGKIHATSGNLNNHIGVPLTVLGLGDQHQIALVEMGTNHPGEIASLCEIAKPDSGIITNIGSSHLEFFQTEQNVFFEKKKLFDYIVQNFSRRGFFVINKSDSFLAGIDENKSLNYLTVGAEDADVVVSMPESNRIVLGKHYKKEIDAKNSKITGKHNFLNLALAMVVAMEFVPQKIKEIQRAAENFSPRNKRSLWISVEGNKKIFFDAYNANPSSMKASLEAFIGQCEIENISRSKRCYILGDMNELGETACEFHQEIGRYLSEQFPAKVIFVGKYAKEYQKGLGGEAKIFATTEELKREWANVKRDAEYFFIKASRSLQFESLLDI